ncbi:unnamed protein product [Rotaria sp. Silwood2]|nr:unnamed protein product [Rotaria sp. Silwood2]
MCFSVIGYSDEQFDRVSNAIILLLAHNDADYRLIAASTLVNLSRETKAIDIALLNSFLNDSRILVRTECCESLKKLTGIMSDTVLNDCANDISYLQTLPEENFSLQNYLQEKNRLPTPPVINQSSPQIEEQINEDVGSRARSCSSSSQVIEQVSVINSCSMPTHAEPNPFSVPSSVISSMTHIQPTIRVEISEKRTLDTSHMPKSRKERTPSETKRSSLLPNNTNMWDSYAKQNETTEQKDIEEPQVNFFPESQTFINNQEQFHDSIQTILEEHKQNVGFYRMLPNRRVLIPKKVSMGNVFCDHSHMIMNQDSSQPSSRVQNTMNLSNLNHNQNQLNEVEFVQLLSSLVVRALQVHRQHEKIIPGSSLGNFANVLSISPMQIHSSSNVYQLHVSSPTKLPYIIHQRPTSRQFAHIQSTAQKKAAKEVLKSQGTLNSENCLQKIIHSYPKFIPLLHTRIPQNLIPVIWNDPIIKQIASIFNNRQDELIVEDSSIKESDTKQSIPNIDDEHSVHDYNYTTSISRDPHNKRFLPPIRGSKIHLPHHVLKFGFREIEINSSESPNHISLEESQLKSRKRRIYMHLMMSANENVSDRHEPVKNQLRHVVKTDYPTASFMPIVSRPPMCH